MGKIIPMQNTCTLLREVQQNNRRAQRKLYERYAPRLLSVCHWYIKDFEFAQDAMSRAFLKIFNSILEFKGTEEKALYSWMRKITVNECLDFLRSKMAKNSFDYLEDLHEQIAMPNLSQLTEKELENILNILPTGCRIVFVLYVLEDMKHHEIAEKLGISVGTGKSQVAYAKKILKTNLSKETLYAQ
ncbi:RNA polymerase sigma factor [Ornithobacterium rhinotracheale]|uniref:RNA polymerase sigma factor n=1 Tax=Ornithobacterium rhinotracheale TaxID=28251 RepID=UPI001FF487C9|nr:RNA polymerase sigma factor [Ornithobacterium rhinotracheale]MCK0200998.1 RNA polymerase sigma factor [Ornithobacterium rhinotracheale]UVD87364.1 RNA polymerase sigma factor [Ornithobacterium rhinotracheale]